jgi:hypothetical protein
MRGWVNASGDSPNTGCTAKYFSPKYYKNTEKIFQSKSKYFLNTSTQSCIKISK